MKVKYIKWCQKWKVNTVHLGKPPSFKNKLKLLIKIAKAKKMEGNSSTGSTPKMDWASNDLTNAWKAF